MSLDRFTPPASKPRLPEKPELHLNEIHSKEAVHGRGYYQFQDLSPQDRNKIDVLLNSLNIGVSEVGGIEHAAFKELTQEDVLDIINYAKMDPKKESEKKIRDELESVIKSRLSEAMAHHQIFLSQKEDEESRVKPAIGRWRNTNPQAEEQREAA